MAPEQCRDEAATPATDLFALGALLFEAATGEHAFHPRRLGTEWLYPQLAGVAPRRLPDALGAVIGQLLDPEPARRPVSATEVLWALAQALPRGAVRLWPEWLNSGNLE
jgi:serine/threonine protein kinase